MLSKQYVQALKIIHNKLSQESFPWVVYGSSGLALRGWPFKAHDVDILTSTNGALKMNELFKEHMIRPVHLNKESDRFESYIGEFCINGIKIEPVGNFHRIKNDEKISLTHTINDPDFIKLEGIKIPVMSIKNQLEAYGLCDREKDQIKIRKIKELLAV